MRGAIAALLVGLASSAAAEPFITLFSDNGEIMAIVDAGVMQYAIGAEENLVIQFLGSEANRLTISATGANARTTVQTWLLAINEGVE